MSDSTTRWQSISSDTAPLMWTTDCELAWISDARKMIVFARYTFLLYLPLACF